MLKTLALATAIALGGSAAQAACSFENDTRISYLGNAFGAIKAITQAMAECGNFEAELDKDFVQKLVPVLSSEPALYQIVMVTNAAIVPVLDAGLIRPLDDLIAKHGQELKANQLVRLDGKVMAISTQVNNQHLMYRADILNELGLEVPETYDDVLAAAATIRDAGVVEYPLGGTYKQGWNLAEEFVNMYLGMGGSFFTDGAQPAIDNAEGVAALEMMKKLTAYMDPEFLVSDSTYVQQQFQQGKIAMANLWATRAAAMDDTEESQVVGKVKMAGAPLARPDGVAASTLWWGGFAIASNIPDDLAETAFRVALEGADADMVKANNDLAVWLIDGFEPGPAAMGAIETVHRNARPYPSSVAMGLMHSALGNGIAEFLTGRKDAQTTLADIEAAYLSRARETGLVK